MFRQLVVVRAHATRALADACETEPTLARRDAWVSALATVESRTDRLDLRRRYRVVDDDYAAVRAMLQRNLVEHPSRTGARMAGWLHGYWYYRGQLVEAVRWLELAVEALDGEAEAIDEAWVHSDWPRCSPTRDGSNRPAGTASSGSPSPTGSQPST